MTQETEELLKERHRLACERISEIARETDIGEEAAEYFQKTAKFLMLIEQAAAELEEGKGETYTLEEWQKWNHALYEDILPENYETSYANPAYAAKKLGEETGKLLSALYAELRGSIVYAYEQRLEDRTILEEVFIEIYNVFEQEVHPSYRQLQQILYWFFSDNSDLTVTSRVREIVDPDLDFAARIICKEDLNDLRYLYKYGEYVSENELAMARHMNSLPQETIDLMAQTYTEGYRIGFENAGKDLKKKKTVNIRYTLGFERMIRKAIENFAEMGLRPVLYRAAVSSASTSARPSKTDIMAAIPTNSTITTTRQMRRCTSDKPFIQRKLGVLKTAYETYKELAGVHAGPAVVEIFGEKPFAAGSKRRVLPSWGKTAEACRRV